jgi:hypothetical protein
MSYHVIRDGSAVPAAVVEVIAESAKAFTHDLAWVPFDLSRGTGEECSYEESRQHLWAIVRHVRAERQRTRWQGEYEYFVHLKHYDLVTDGMSGIDLDHVHSVIRRENGLEEVYVREGLWVRSNQLHEAFSRWLPLSAEEVEQVTARLSRSRCLVVDDGRDVPRAVVHLDGETERVFDRNLEWRTAALLAEVADHPHWTVEESNPGRELHEAYSLARRVREFKQRHEWGGDVWYFGIYDTLEETFDIDATRFLVATDAGDKWFGELYVGQGRWHPTRRLDDIWRGRRHDPELALSPAEAKRIMKRRG